MVKSFLLVLGLVLSLRAQAAKLFFLESTGTQECVAKYLELPSQKETILMRTQQCPDNLIWDQKNQTLYYTTEGFLFSRSANPKSKMGPQKLAKLPQKENLRLALDSEKNQPLISYLVEIPQADVKTSGEDNDRKESFVFEGKTIDASATPPWGTPNVAVSAYLYNGHWKRIEVVATKSNAGDTLGLDALPVRKSFGLSWAEIAKKMFCYSGKLECGLSDTKFGKLVGDKEGYNYGRIKAPPAEFIFATIQGDTLHGAAPVFYCEKDCAKPKKLKEVMDAQIGFALQDNFLLVATEYDAGNPKVYDTTNGKLIYENAHATKTIWFPGE